MTLRLLLCLSLAGCAAAPTTTSTPAQDAVEVRFIGINDFHGNLEPTGLRLSLADPAGSSESQRLSVSVGGAAALAGMVQKLRAGAADSLFVAGGDLIGGAPLPSSLFRHESTVEILGDMGLDVSALGNHEFDAGEKELQRLIKGGCAPKMPYEVVVSCPDGKYAGARYTYIAANVIDAKGKPIVAPYVIRTFKGIPVGVIGGVTKTTPQMVLASNIAGLQFLDEADAVNLAVKELRAKDVKAMIAVFHEGFELGTFPRNGDWNDVRCPEAHGALLGIVKRLDPAIKVVFSGHTHQGYRCELDGRTVIQGTSYGRGISVVDVMLDPKTRTMSGVVRSYNLAVLNDETDPAHREKLAAAAPEPFGRVLREAKPDPKVAQKVAHYAALTAPLANRPVGRITGPFTRGGPVDSTLGRLIADAQLAATRSQGAQIAFMNPGGIRANFDCATPPCTVTYGQAFIVQPFANSLVTMTLNGAQIRALLESQLRGARGEPRVLQPSEGLSYTWQASAAPGERVRELLLNGEPIVADKKYRVTVNSFLAEGGDAFNLLRDGTDRIGGGLDIDALVAYLGTGDKSPIPTPRVKRL
jgi:5'-nucleotidase